MVTVHREAGFRFVIYSDDHDPAHVHVVGDGNAKVDLGGGNGMPEMVYAGGFKQGDVRRILDVVRKHRTMFLKRWNDIHG